MEMVEFLKAITERPKNMLTTNLLYLEKQYLKEQEFL
jgi:hypothetical protein